MNVNAQMGLPVPQNNEGRRPASNLDNHAGGASSADLDIMGDGAAVGLYANVEKMTTLSTESGKPSAATQFTLSGNTPDTELTAPQGFEISQQETNFYRTSIKAGQASPVIIWVRLTGSKPDGANNSVSGDITISDSSGKKPIKVPVKGSVK